MNIKDAIAGLKQGDFKKEEEQEHIEPYTDRIPKAGDKIEITEEGWGLIPPTAHYMLKSLSPHTIKSVTPVNYRKDGKAYQGYHAQITAPEYRVGIVGHHWKYVEDFSEVTLDNLEQTEEQIDFVPFTGRMPKQGDKIELTERGLNQIPERYLEQFKEASPHTVLGSERLIYEDKGINYEDYNTRVDFCEFTVGLVDKDWKYVD